MYFIAKGSAAMRGTAGNAVQRFHQQGWSIARIAEKTGMPPEFIEGLSRSRQARQRTVSPHSTLALS
jgi:hypothetical protein